MQCKQTVLSCEVVQINTQRWLPTLTRRAQPVSVDMAQLAMGLFPYSVQCKHSFVGTLEIPQQKEDGDRHSSWSLNRALTPVLKWPHTKQATFPFWQRFWPLVLMAFDIQRIKIAGKMLQERKEVSALSVQLLYFKTYPKSNGSMGILPETSTGIL